MSDSSTLSFTRGATIVAALAASLLTLGLRGAAGDSSSWAISGFAMMALSVIATGALLANAHGRPGVRFVAVVGAGLLLRTLVVAAFVVAGIQDGTAALLGTLAGLAVGFVPLTAFEMIWFARRAHGGPRRYAERRG